MKAPIESRTVRPAKAAGRTGRRSNLRLLGDLQGVIHLNAEVSHGRLQLGVSEQQLHRPKVLGAPIDQRRLGAPQ